MMRRRFAELFYKAVSSPWLWLGAVLLLVPLEVFARVGGGHSYSGGGSRGGGSSASGAILTVATRPSAAPMRRRFVTRPLHGTTATTLRRESATVRFDPGTVVRLFQREVRSGEMAESRKAKPKQASTKTATPPRPKRPSPATATLTQAELRQRARDRAGDSDS